MINSAILVMILYSNFVSSTDVEDAPEYYERIWQGKIVEKVGAYPYFCSIQIPDGKGYRHFCGGALVDRRIVVTAAHCLQNASLVSKFRILPNEGNKPIPISQTFQVKDYVIHPEMYEPGSRSKHDIAVILLDQPDKRTDSRIALPFRHLPVNTNLKIMGFGLIGHGVDMLATELREATVSILNDKKCIDEKTPFEYAEVYNFCTHNKEGAGGCYNDAGSPAVWENPQDKNSYLYGVLSSEQSPCNTFHTDVFVNVFEHLKFIQDAYIKLSREEFGCKNEKYREAEQSYYLDE